MRISRDVALYGLAFLFALGGIVGLILRGPDFLNGLAVLGTLVSGILAASPLGRKKNEPATPAAIVPAEPARPARRASASRNGTGGGALALFLVAGLAALLLAGGSSAGCGPGAARPDVVVDAALDVVGLGCDGLARVCAPGAELLAPKVCRYLVPGCYGAAGLAGVFLRAGAPAGPALSSAGVFYAESYEGELPVFSLEELAADCDDDGEPVCAALRSAAASGRDVALVARR